MNIREPISEGRFIKRLNRFEAIVDTDGSENLVHVPNTGRLKELLVEGAEVILKKFNNPNRKTRYGLFLVKKDGIWVSIDSANVPNQLVYELLMQKTLPRFETFNSVGREVVFGESRFDFKLSSDEEEYFIEVKGVTLVEDGTAYFPDAPTTRGQKHLEELIHLKSLGKGAGVIFIIQRDDAHVFKPNDRTDPAFARLLRAAYNSGVDLWAYKCAIDLKEIRFLCEIPIVL